MQRGDASTAWALQCRWGVACTVSGSRNKFLSLFLKRGEASEILGWQGQVQAVRCLCVHTQMTAASREVTPGGEWIMRFRKNPAPSPSG